MEKMFAERPVIFDYGAVPDYVRDMLRWRRKHTNDFSVRKITGSISGCSPTLVTQVAKGHRDLTRDRVDAFSVVLGLSPQEKVYLDQWVVRQKKDTIRRRYSFDRFPYDAEGRVTRARTPTNHLLNDWVNVYVKDSCRLKGFDPNPKTIHRLLGGIVPLKRIAKSVDFLFKEGFFRKTLDGRIVESTPVTDTTDGIPDKKIQAFHKRALDIAKRGIDLFPVSERRSSAVVLPVDEKNLDKLRALLIELHERVAAFAEENQKDSERLYQVVINLCPIGGRLEPAPVAVPSEENKYVRY